MTTIAISHCDDYGLEKVSAATKRCLSLIGNIETIVRPGMKVLLKLNLLSASLGPERAVNTHPAVIRALVDIFMGDYGCEVYIGDSCGSLRTGSTDKAFRVTQIDKIAEDTGAIIVNFDKDEALDITNKNAVILKDFKIAKTVKSVDVVVNVPKLKTHGLTRYTGAIKNMFGSIPANGKKNVHLLAPKNRSMAQALVDVFEMVQPHITIMDAVIGMEGNGPNAGDPRKVGLIIAGIDGVALDAVASTIIGFDPMKVPIIKYAHERKLGTADMNKIDVSGEDICKVAVSDFKKPSSSAQDFASNYIPDFLLAKMFDNSCSSVSSVYEPNCTRCYECIRNCPAKAMSAPDGRVIVDEDKCIGCFCCDEVCNYKAIVMKRTFLGRAFLKMAVFLGVERLQ
ncbi:MAG: DUF362 domain-containing protein [Candidatus Scalindua sp.]|jgi:uncharacterized protein (DUF362 family)/NAD-dependent dihydropyrimidine dehydrogenase PreA subunit|nr:DUF362 domain-containing protein [Candidatus Scalindua sp.]